jgi:primosomal protein N' (replication factor Y)
MSQKFVDVLVPVALDQTYSYRVPDGETLAAGDIVAVPLGARTVMGVVWAADATPEPRIHNRIKDVSEKLDYPPLQAELRTFVDWVAGYTLSPRGMVMRMTLRMGDELGPERVRLGVRLIGKPPERLTPARRRVIALLSDGFLRAKSEAAQEAGVSGGVIDGLVDEGTLEVVPMPKDLAAPPPDPDFAIPDFSPEQGEAVATMRELATDSFAVALLDGVTG